MNKKITFSLIAGIVFIAVLGGALYSSTASATEAVPADQTLIRGDTGTYFTYQGRLTNDSGSPIAGPCDFKFNLFEAGFAGAKLDTEEKLNQALSDGYFSVYLDYGNAAFSGEGRSLQVEVRCPAGGGDYTTLTPAVDISPAPYAHSLRPGAIISSDSAGELGSVLKIEDTYSGILASTALKVVSTGDVGTESKGGYKGVHGEATTSGITTYGVYGKSASTSGYGVYGTNASTSPDVGAVTGNNISSGSGVYGFSINGYGLYGRSTNNKALYSDGDAHIEGALTWKTMTSNLSVSTAGFTPELYQTTSFHSYVNEGYRLYNEDTVYRWFTAPVQLPDKATVTKLTWCFYDGTDDDVYLNLKIRELDVGSLGTYTVASVGSSGSASSPSSTCYYTEGISYATIDNSDNAYYLDINMPPNGSKPFEFYGAVIEYEISQPY